MGRHHPFFVVAGLRRPLSIATGRRLQWDAADLSPGAVLVAAPFVSSPDQAAGASGGANPWLEAPDLQALEWTRLRESGFEVSL